MVNFTFIRCSSLIRISDKVKSALNAGKPVVALESTVITHGLPFPKNLEVGRELERIVREEGGTPATIALMSGHVKVGLTESELEEIADPKCGAVKVSTRDVPNALAKNLVGGTTVAATTKIASLVGIKVFATGGIGGVHRGAEKTFDISADLVELGRNPVAVICAGAKSILDIPKTLEFLETVGTNVVVFDKEAYFPGFFTRRTKYKAPFNSDSLVEIAQLIKTTDELNLSNGTLVACPLPKEFEDESELIERAVEQALEEASERSISAKEVTPFLLKRVNELTNSVSMKLNIALLKNNARIATRLANEISKRTTSTVHSVQKQSIAENKHPKVLCVGGSIYDLEIVLSTEPKNDGGSYPSEMYQRAGGVGRNHAEAFTRLGCDTSLISVVGNDVPGKFLFPEHSIVKKDHVYWVDNVATSSYVAVNVSGNIRHGFSAIEPASKELTPSRVEAKGHLFETSDYIFLEGNLQPQTLKKSVELANIYGKKIWYDPTDINKVWKIVETESVDKITCFSPNANEFIEYCRCLGVSIPVESLVNFNALADFINTNKSFLHRIFPDQMEFLIVTLGANGCLLLSRSNQTSTIEITTIDAPTKQKIVSASGSGDCFNSAFLTAHLHGANAESCMRSGQLAAGLSLQSLKTVPESIDFKTVVEPFL